MKFPPGHARDVATPSAVLLVDTFFPEVRGKARSKLIRRLTGFLMTTLSAFCAFHPAPAVPEPSSN